MEPVIEGSEIKETPVVTAHAESASEAKLVFGEKDIEENKLVAALSYIWILFLIPLLVKKDSSFAQFHARQGLVMVIASFLFSLIPFFGWLGNVVLFFVCVLAVVKTLSGEAWEIPLVKDAVKKFNI
jgi:uncharacterized membrane protein